MAEIPIPGETSAATGELIVHPTASRLAALQQVARFVQERVAGTPVEEAARRAGTSGAAIRAMGREVKREMQRLQDGYSTTAEALQELALLRLTEHALDADKKVSLVAINEINRYLRDTAKLAATQQQGGAAVPLAPETEEALESLDD